MANYAIAVHDNDTNLAIFTPGLERTRLGVQRGTSPAITPLPSGKCYVAFHSTDPRQMWFWRNQPPGAKGLGGHPDLNTSPAVAYAPRRGILRIAFAANGTLNNFEGSSSDTQLTEVPTTFGISPGTNPALAARSDGESFLVAFSDTQVGLFLGDGAQPVNTGRRMMPKTNPSVATWSRHGRMIAYQSAEGFVSAWGSEDGSDWKVPIRRSSSPSVAAQQDGTWMVALQSPFGELKTITSEGAFRLGVHVRKDSSPAIAALSDGTFVIAYCDAKSGNLCTINPSQYPPQPSNRGIGIFPGTGPAITALT